MGFIAPIFLLGLVALLAPWLLHRLNERNAPVQDFPSHQFLEPARSIRARQKKLRYLRLLALRLLALLMLCLLFAEPLLKRWDLLSGEVPQLHMLVIDQSFSMRAGARWPDALEQLTNALGEIPEGMPMQLIGVDGAATTRVTFTRDREQIEAGMQSLQPGFSSFDYATLMRQLNSLAERQELPVQVHLFTDLQGNAMPARLNDLRAEEVAGLRIWNVAASDPVNTALTAEIVPIDEMRFSIEVAVKRFGDNSRFAEQRLRVSAPGEDPVDLPVPADGDQVTVVFENLVWPTIDRTIRYTVELSPGDELAADDRLELPVRAAVPSVIRVIDSAGSRAASGSDAWLYLSTALKLESSLQVTRVAPGTNESSANADVMIVVDDTPVLEGSLPELSERLQRYLDSGGALLYVLNSTERGSASSRLAEKIAHVNTVDETHPLSLDASAWREADFYIHQSVAAGSADVLMTTDAGNPVLLESRRESGKLIWLNAALNGSDNNVPVSPVFVPFLHSLADYYLYYDRYPTQLSVGDNVKLGQSVQLLDPAGDSLLNLSESVGGSMHVVAQPGIYTILDQLGEHPVSVSVDPRESDTRVAVDSTVAAWASVAGATTSTTTSAATDTSGSDDPAADVTLISIARWLLPLCVFLFILEALFANDHLRVRRA